MAADTGRQRTCELAFDSPKEAGNEAPWKDECDLGRPQSYRGYCTCTATHRPSPKRDTGRDAGRFTGKRSWLRERLNSPALQFKGTFHVCERPRLAYTRRKPEAGTEILLSVTPAQEQVAHLPAEVSSSALVVADGGYRRRMLAAL